MGDAPHDALSPLPLQLCRIDVDRIIQNTGNNIFMINHARIPAPTTDIFGRVINNPYPTFFAGDSNIPVPFSEGPYSFQLVMEREARWRPTIILSKDCPGPGPHTVESMPNTFVSSFY